MHALTKTHVISTQWNEIIVNLTQFLYRKCHSYFFGWSYGSFQLISLFFFLTCIFLLLVFSLWISWSVSLSSLFIYFLSYLSLCLLSVSLVKSKLDPESLGIILLGPFLLEFFPDQVCAYVCVRRGGLPLQRRKHKQDDIYLLPAIQSTPHS